MRPDYRGATIKHANSPDEAAKLIGKYVKKDSTILDNRGNLLSNVSIHEEN